ncbi:hypothetical protein QR680_017482 [Steinernema hermaphroditum]|uniref:DH domain-containing protein n=1 Tax=Steinernema hermaphroditum TaxID=289476 RepID=A0AA39LPE1_9BILA|nr:hypothetical protein QR680_017482 [Steinernema hermaphroditum]
MSRLSAVWSRILPHSMRRQESITEKPCRTFEVPRMEGGAARFVVGEFVRTEIAYIDDLDSVLTFYVEPFESPASSNLIPQTLHGRSKSISLHRELAFSSSGDYEDTIVEIAAKLVHEKERFLRVYLRRTRLTSREVMSHDLSLDSFLLKPVQRLTKYQLLLEELGKKCESHRCLLSAALASVRDLLLEINVSMQKPLIRGFLGRLEEFGRLCLQTACSVRAFNSKNCRIITTEAHSSSLRTRDHNLQGEGQCAEADGALLGAQGAHSGGVHGFRRVFGVIHRMLRCLGCPEATEILDRRGRRRCSTECHSEVRRNDGSSLRGCSNKKFFCRRSGCRSLREGEAALCRPSFEPFHQTDDVRTVGRLSIDEEKHLKGAEAVQLLVVLYVMYEIYNQIYGAEGWPTSKTATSTTGTPTAATSTADAPAAAASTAAVSTTGAPTAAASKTATSPIATAAPVAAPEPSVPTPNPASVRTGIENSKMGSVRAPLSSRNHLRNAIGTVIASEKSNKSIRTGMTPRAITPRDGPIRPATPRSIVTAVKAPSMRS